MKYLNLGCGSHFSTNSEWTNLDFTSNSTNVIEHNLLSGIPFSDNTYDLVYHSHVLEHFSQNDGKKLIKECFRVLKPDGVLRIAIPDLESITENYLHFLRKGMEDLSDSTNKANYEWMKIEMYDQTVRNTTGGEMLNYLAQTSILNENFVYKRIGEEGRELRKKLLQSNTSASNSAKKNRNSYKQKLKNYLIKKLHINETYQQIGAFRLGGEIHQWMYDRYSLHLLLNECGGYEIQIRDAFTSYIMHWKDYNLDGWDTIIRKPDSLFIECKKK